MTEKPTEDAAKPGTAERIMAIQITLMLLLPILSKKNAIDGKEFANLASEVAKDVADSMGRPQLIGAMESLLQSLRSLGVPEESPKE